MVRLVIEAVTPLEPVLRVLRDVQNLFPAVRYELRTERLTGAIEALAVRARTWRSRRARDRRAHMTARRFRDVRIIPVVRHDHPLARAGAPVPTALLRKHAQIVLRDSASGELTQTLNVLEGGLRWTVTDVASKLQIIEAGLGWGGLPEHVVAPGLKRYVGRTHYPRVRCRRHPALHAETTRPSAGPVAQALWARLGSRTTACPDRNPRLVGRGRREVGGSASTRPNRPATSPSNFCLPVRRAIVISEGHVVGPRRDLGDHDGPACGQAKVRGRGSLPRAGRFGRVLADPPLLGDRDLQGVISVRARSRSRPESGPERLRHRTGGAVPAAQCEELDRADLELAHGECDQSAVFEPGSNHVLR